MFQMQKLRRIGEKTTPIQFYNLTSKLKIKLKQKQKIRAQYCTNTHDEQNARVEILNSWWDKQEEANVLMGKALIRAELKRIAREVWNYPPRMQTSKRSSHNNATLSNKRMRT